jgi:hypothetical protein
MSSRRAPTRCRAPPWPVRSPAVAHVGIEDARGISEVTSTEDKLRPLHAFKDCSSRWARQDERSLCAAASTTVAAQQWVDTVDKGVEAIVLLKATRKGIGRRSSLSGLVRSPHIHRTDANSRARRHVRWRPEQAQRHRLKVLHDGGKVELVACAGETAQPQSLEAVVGL